MEGVIGVEHGQLLAAEEPGCQQLSSGHNTAITMSSSAPLLGTQYSVVYFLASDTPAACPGVLFMGAKMRQFP